MSQSTRGKRTASKPALKRRGASERKRAIAKANAAFPGGAKKTEGETQRVVPRMRRA